jgi:hypothetical protein
MAIRHATTVATPDDGSEVGSNAWNANHVMTDTVAVSSLNMVSATTDVKIDFGSAENCQLQLLNTNSTGGCPDVRFITRSTTPAASDRVGGLLFCGQNSNGDFVNYNAFSNFIVDPTAGAEYSRMSLGTFVNGVNDYGLHIQNQGISLGDTLPAAFAQGSITIRSSRGIYDANGNETLIVQQASSAANHIEVVSANANGDPAIQAAGSDTNVSLQLRAKAAGEVAFYTNSSQRVIIDSSGCVSVNTPTTGTVFAGFGVQFEVNATNNTVIALNRFADSANGATISVNKSRGSSVGVLAIVQSNDVIGQFVCNGVDGETIRTATVIRGVVDVGTPSTTSMPGRIEFLTTPDGTVTAVHRMAVKAAGGVIVGSSSVTASTAGTLVVENYIRNVPVTAGSLPAAAAGNAGARHFVTDATTNVFATTVVGGSTYGVPVYSDGTAWKIG